MYYFFNLDYELTELLLIILFSPKVILNSVGKERLDLVSNNLSQLYYSIKNLTLILWWGEVDHQWPRPFSAL
jgi:hypothetical protein